MLRALSIALLASSCAFSDGKPWGKLDVSLSTVHELPDKRLDEAGRLITAADYAIRVDTLSLKVDSIVLRLAGGDATFEAFDPANPPPGYSFCHNGHCHADSGELVEYEDIAAELASGNSAGGAVVALAPTEPLTRFERGPLGVTLLDCPNNCFVEPGSLRVAEVTVTEVRLAGRVFDRRTGDAMRLPPEGVDINETLTVSARPQVEVAATFGRDEKLGARVKLTLALSAKVFDEVDFSTVLDSTQQDAFAVALDRELSISADISLFDKE